MPSNVADFQDERCHQKATGTAFAPTDVRRFTMITAHAHSAVVAHAPLAERRSRIRREAMRDFAGIALGVATGGVIWFAFLSLARASL